MQISKLFTVINLKQRAREARENWFPWLVITIGTITYYATVVTITDGTLKRSIEATRLEQIGTAWVLFGALWTALGPHLTRNDKAALDEMASKGQLDAKEIIRIFKAASNFSTFGALMIVLGSAVLLYKMLLH